MKLNSKTKKDKLKNRIVWSFNPTSRIKNSKKIYKRNKKFEF